MISDRDGHVRVLPLHVANKIAAGEVVERPASVVKELVENAIDAGARHIAIAVTQGGRKLVSVRDDGCGMSRDDAVLSLERQATSKIRDVSDIEEIDTLGFRGEAIPSIASVSRFSITTRRSDSDEGTFIQVNSGILAEVQSAGCPVGTLVEVRDLFCNVPARRKFLRAYATEESHVKQVFTTHALAHPAIGFSLTVDGRELYRLAPSACLKDRVLDLFGPEFMASAVPIGAPGDRARDCRTVCVTGFVERPNLATPTRRDQYVFVNGRPATSPSVAYAIKEAYPRRPGDSRPAVLLFIDLPPNQVDVNVHPTKREVRFRDNVSVKTAIVSAIGEALACRPDETVVAPCKAVEPPMPEPRPEPRPGVQPENAGQVKPNAVAAPCVNGVQSPHLASLPTPKPSPVEVELPIVMSDGKARPWKWFKYLAQADSGYLLVETDEGIVTINPHAARERIAYERLLDGAASQPMSQALLIPETVQLSPVDFSRLSAAMPTIRAMGFQLEAFGRDTVKVDAVPQLIGAISPAKILATIARDLGEGGTKRSGERWREELVAKSIARSFAGIPLKMTEDGAVSLVEELCACRMPYVCPRGKMVMMFTSTRELDRKFGRA